MFTKFEREDVSHLLNLNNSLERYQTKHFLLLKKKGRIFSNKSHQRGVLLFRKPVYIIYIYNNKKKINTQNILQRSLPCTNIIIQIKGISFLFMMTVNEYCEDGKRKWQTPER